MKYAELLCKTNYSFLRGASHSHELMARAAQVKLEALAITDVGGVYGMPKAYHALKDLPEAARPKLIVGAEIPIVDHPSITLLAQNRAAYGLLCRILTECHRDRPKAKPLSSWQALLSFLEDPESKSKASGLIAILTSAPGTRFGDLKEIFKERIALPLFRFLDGQDSARTEYALDIRNKFEIPIIASNDVHFHVRERRKLQEIGRAHV